MITKGTVDQAAREILRLAGDLAETEKLKDAAIQALVRERQKHAAVLAQLRELREMCEPVLNFFDGSDEQPTEADWFDLSVKGIDWGNHGTWNIFSDIQKVCRAVDALLDEQLDTTETSR